MGSVLDETLEEVNVGLNWRRQARYGIVLIRLLNLSFPLRISYHGDVNIRKSDQWPCIHIDARGLQYEEGKRMFESHFEINDI